MQIKKSTAFWGALLVLALLLYATTERTGQPITNKRSAQQKANPIAISADDQVINSILAAEEVLDPYRRCIEIPIPRDANWPAKTIEAFCDDLTSPTLTWFEITSTIDSDTGRLLDARFDQLFNAFYSGELPEGALNNLFENNFGLATVRKHKLVDRWLAVSPDSTYALTAKGMLLLSDAWQERGNKLARLTSKAQLDRMSALAQEAKRYLKRAIAINPKNIKAHDVLIQTAKALGDVELATKTLRELQATAPYNYAGFFSFANTMEPRWLGDYFSYQAIAVEAAQLAIHNPRFVNLVAEVHAYDISRIHYRDTRYKEIGDRLAPIVRSAPHYNLIQRYAETLLQTGRHLEAFEYYSQVLRFSPAYARMYHLRGKAALNMQRYAVATQDFNKAVMLNPNDQDIQFDFIYLMMRKEQHRDALSRIEKLLATAPQNSWLLEQAAWIAVFRTLDEKKARTYIDRGLAAHPAAGAFHWLNWEIIRRTGAPGVKAATLDFIQHADKKDARQVEALKYTSEYLQAPDTAS